MGFNADAFLAAHEPWALTLGGRQYVARPVSAPVMLKMQAAIVQAPTAEEQFLLFLSLLRLAFPRRWSYRWSGDPVAKVALLPPAALKELQEDFFGYLAGVTRPRAAPATSGTPSPT